MCKNEKAKDLQTIDSIIDDYFKTDDYSNDNLPDVLYWCVKGIILLHLLKHPITKEHRVKSDIEFIAYNELLRLSLDAVFLRLRLFTSTAEKYSGGKFLKELKDFSNLESSLKSTYGQFIKPENEKIIKKICKSIPSTYNNLYGYKKGAKCPVFIHEYEKEKFHQDNHSGGCKYKILGYTEINFNQTTVTRREKPTIDFLRVYDCFEQLSETVLNFCKICDFRYNCNRILRDCNRYHDNLDRMIRQAVSIYKYEFNEKFLDGIKELINKNLPQTLKLISQEIIL